MRATAGTGRAVSTTYMDVRCDRFREAASARLDGEPLGTSAAGLDHHLAACPDCARWLADATRLTRQARVGTVRVPDLADRILAGAVLPTRRVLRRRMLLRLGLALVAAIQLIIAVPAIRGVGVGMTMTEHAAHEAASWNIAIGVAFAAAALRPRRAAGLVPLLGTFIVVLAVFCVHDVAAGAVGIERVLTHVAALVGLLLVLAVDRAERALPPRSAADADRDGEQQRRLRGAA